MRIGISSPIVVAVPGSHSPWEREASIDDLSAIAKRADELGFNHLTCAEHVAVPEQTAEKRGGTYWDPLATLSYLAAHTEDIRLATMVVVLGYHHPLAIAKRYGTLDVISNGRLTLGVGVGSLQEEFELLGAQFDRRGPKADEAIAALRASFGKETPQFVGEYYAFEDFRVEPASVQAHVPIWVGGNSRRSLRRAVELGDGWAPFGRPLSEFRSMLDEVSLPEPFDVILPLEGRLDPVGDREMSVKRLHDAQSAGSTIMNASLRASSANHYLEQLHALAEIRDELR